MENLEAGTSRLMRLERELWICKFVMGVCGILIAALAGGEYVALRSLHDSPNAGRIAQRIEAHEFVVLGENNKPIAILGQLFAMQPMLVLSRGLGGLKISSLPFTSEKAVSTFSDLDNWPTLLLTASESKAAMDMRDQKTRSYVSASINEFSSSNADFSLSASGFDVAMRASTASKNQNAEASVTLSRYLPGKTPMDFGGTRGGADLELHDDGGTTLRMHGAHLDDVNDLVELDAPATANPALHLFDSDGQLRASLGSTSLEVTRTGAEETTAPSSLTFFDKKGKVLWQAPR